MVKCEGQSCFNCIHSEFIPGYPGSRYEPPEPDVAECTLEFDKDMYDKFDEVNWDEDKLPFICGKYEPILVGNCSMCNKKIDYPKHLWEIYSYIENEYAEEPNYFCSENCKDAFEVKVTMENSIEGSR